MSDELKNNGDIIDESENSEAAEEIKTLSDIDEIREFNKEVLGKLDSPLVVHKKEDVSYEENTNTYEMNETHTDEERPTLTRHRFKKEKKSKTGLIVILFFIFLFAGIVAALYITGNLPVGNNDVTEPATVIETVTEPTTSVEDNYIGTIVIKGTYIFVDGKEVKGIEGLQDALAYTTPSPTAYEIIDEHANSDYLNGNVLLILEDLGFFDKTTKFTHVEKTGLMSKEETTAPPETTAATTATTAAATQATTKSN